MAWTITILRSAERDLARIDRVWQQRILAFLQDEIGASDDPRAKGQALTGALAGYWRYRVGDYRIVCDLQDQPKVVLVTRVAHRSRIYR